MAKDDGSSDGSSDNGNGMAIAEHLSMEVNGGDRDCSGRRGRWWGR